MHGEGNEQENAGHQRRIKGVGAQTAEDLLTHDDGDERTDEDHPGGRTRGKIHGQKYGRNQSAAIADAAGTLQHFEEGPFEDETAQHGH